MSVVSAEDVLSPGSLPLPEGRREREFLAFPAPPEGFLRKKAREALRWATFPPSCRRSVPPAVVELGLQRTQEARKENPKEKQQPCWAVRDLGRGIPRLELPGWRGLCLRPLALAGLACWEGAQTPFLGAAWEGGPFQGKFSKEPNFWGQGTRLPTSSGVPCPWEGRMTKGLLFIIQI